MKSSSIPKPSLFLAGASGCFGCLGFIVLGIALFVVGGSRGAANGELEPLSPRGGYIRGRAITEDGRRIEKFFVQYAGFPKGALGTYDGNSNLVAPDQGQVEGENGEYAVKVGGGLYGAAARVETEFDGQKWRFHLEATNQKGLDDREDAGEGIVRDFVWKMTGARPGGDPNGTTESRMTAMNGAVLKIDMHSAAEVQNRQRTLAPLREAHPATEVVVTLTPKGKMIDGSDGRVITSKLNTDQSGTIYGVIREIPIGVYEVTAALTDGTALRVSDTYSEQTDEVGIDRRFPGTPTFELHFKANDSVIGGAEIATLYLNR